MILTWIRPAIALVVLALITGAYLYVQHLRGTIDDLHEINDQTVRKLGAADEIIRRQRDQIKLIGDESLARIERSRKALVQGRLEAARRAPIVQEVMRYVPTETDECRAAVRLLDLYFAAASGDRVRNSAPAPGGGDGGPAMPGTGPDSAPARRPVRTTSAADSASRETATADPGSRSNADLWWPGATAAARMRALIW